MPFCLIKPLADKFKQALKEGRIDPQKLMEMSSENRRVFFETIVGKESAGKVNELFEKKSILRDQQRGMLDWAKQLTGLKPEVKKEIYEKINKMSEVLTPERQEAFLEDLVATRLGTRVTFAEAKSLTELADTIAKAKEKPADADGSNLEYGAAKEALESYLADIKRSNEKITAADFKKAPLPTTMEAVSRIAGTAKSLKASLDNSALFRQGGRVLFTHPKIWAKNAAESFHTIYKQLGKKASDDTIMSAVKAEIYSRRNSMNGMYKKMKLDIGTTEEAYPTSLPEKIPGLGRLFKASEAAYTSFLYKIRADIADSYIKIAEVQGVDLGSKIQVEAIGRLVNSLTGRGSLGKFEHVGKTVNNVFFSPKNVKAHIDFLTGHQLEGVFSGERISTKFTRRQASINLLRVIAGTAVILGTAKLLRPDSVEVDPHSSDAGKIKIGNTRFDATAGMGSIAILAMRLLPKFLGGGYSKSTTTGKISPYGNKFGQKNRLNAIADFAGNKFSPSASVIADILRGETFNGGEVTFFGELANLFAPLPTTNTYELLKDPDAAPILAAILADELGISTNTYGPKKKLKKSE